MIRDFEPLRLESCTQYIFFKIKAMHTLRKKISFSDNRVGEPNKNVHLKIEVLMILFSVYVEVSYRMQRASG